MTPNICRSIFARKNANEDISFISFTLHHITLDAKQRFTQEGVNISLIHSSNQSGSDLRSQSVSADLTGHTLTIEFNEDIGKAHISITNNYGVHIESETVYSTPDCFIFTIRDTGIYRIEIIASNGEQYSGNFRIEN